MNLNEKLLQKVLKLQTAGEDRWDYYQERQKTEKFSCMKNKKTRKVNFNEKNS